MRIALAGPSGVGKSTVGRLLAQSRRLSFLDLDEVVGDPVSIFAREGEAGFRARELRALVELSGRDNVVLALGGGSVQNDMSVLDGWPRAVLMASVDSLVVRLGSASRRPMLFGDFPKRVAQLHSERMARWTAFGVRLHTDGLDAIEVARRVEELW